MKFSHHTLEDRKYIDMHDVNRTHGYDKYSSKIIINSV